LETIDTIIVSLVSNRRKIMILEFPKCKKNIWVFYHSGSWYTTKNLVAFFLLYFFLESPNFSFGGGGPFDHQVIQISAFERFTEDKPFEINFFCMNAIIQGNYSADGNYADLDAYHCDNSNFVGCSQTLNNLMESTNSINLGSGLINLGLGMHIIQDFYAHSNWTEIVENDVILAPIRRLNNPAIYLLFPNLQSGTVPLIPFNTNVQVDCFLKNNDEWGKFIEGATHSCISKDDNLSIRGGTYSKGNPLKTYHEIAAELAIKHSVQLLNELYKKKNPVILKCLTPKMSKTGCSPQIQKKLLD
jgi:hypothetical protein